MAFFTDNQDLMVDPGGYITEETYHAMRSKTTNRRDELMIVMLWETGARATELLGVRFNDCILAQRQVFVRDLKKRAAEGKERKRIVYISNDTCELIREYKRHKKPTQDGYYFQLKWHDKDIMFPISRDMLLRIVKKLAFESGSKTVSGKEIHTHHFRHGFAMNWVKNKGDVGELRIILGHSSLAITQNYLKYSNEDILNEHGRIFG